MANRSKSPAGMDVQSTAQRAGASTKASSSTSTTAATTADPNLPQFLAQSPWYLAGQGTTPAQSDHGATVDALAHQRRAQPTADAAKDDDAPRRIVHAAAPRTYIAGTACTNCGSAAHSADACIARPRRRGAAVTRKAAPSAAYHRSDAAAFEAKRDRWRGYQAAEHLRVLREDQQREAAQARAHTTITDSNGAQGGKDTGGGADSATAAATASHGDSSHVSPARAALLKRLISERAAAQLQREKNKEEVPPNIALEVLVLVRSTRDWAPPAASAALASVDSSASVDYGAHALRQRDTFPKYLVSLDTSDNAAWYDAKSRSLRGNPLADAASGARVYDVGFHGDKERLEGGDVPRLMAQRLHVHRMQRHREQGGGSGAGASEGGDAGAAAAQAHTLALPTAAEDVVKAREDVAPRVRAAAQDRLARLYGPSAAADGPVRGRRVTAAMSDAAVDGVHAASGRAAASASAAAATAAPAPGTGEDAGQQQERGSGRKRRRRKRGSSGSQI